MKEYTLKIDFNNQRIIPNQEIELVQNDYNSTKFNFIFDDEYSEYTKVFELKYPSGKKWIKKIINDEVILADYDEDGNIIPILIKEGDYKFEVVLYDENSKLTNFATGKFFVRPELVNPTDEEIELDDRLPILDDLIQETTALKDGYEKVVEQGNYAEEQGDYAKQEATKVDEVVDYVVKISEEAKDYADSIKPTKTSQLTNDSNFAKTDSNNNFSVSQTINGTLTINGNLVQNGEEYESHAEKVYSEDDLITTRHGAVGGLSEGQYTGIQAEKYDGENDGQLVFDANGEARVGDVGDTQPLLTRDEIANLVTGQVLVWDGTKLQAIGSDEFEKTAKVNEKLALKLSTTDVAEEQYTITYEDGTTKTIKAVVYK